MGRPKVRHRVLAIDPFDISQRPAPAELGWAKWFKEITEGVNPPYHIRRIHYRTLGKLKPDDSTYENTTNNSSLLAKASIYARYLGLVDFDLIEDRKNEGEVVQVVYDPDEVSTDFSINPKSFTYPEIDGAEDVVQVNSENCIEYGVGIRQPYHLEIWVEKSTMNDILIPITKKYRTRLVVASGQFSLTNVKDLYEGIKDLEKPVRIFYLRDFDPAGENMPTAVARKIEWFIRTRRPEIDLKLFDVALTDEQCVKYKLPRTPISEKKGLKYKAAFEEKYGEGATELDALEALHPGTLTNILDDAISPYFDEELEETITDLEESETERLEQSQEDIVSEIVESKRVKLDPLIEEYNILMEKVNSVGSKIEALMESTRGDYSFEAEYPEESDQVVDEEADPILDTRISYEEQLKKYRNEV
ncbi:MAG: hypothetical protein ABSH06_21230 [Thermodesulfobacteriota bacterium]|jgi:hypothetical protein